MSSVYEELRLEGSFCDAVLRVQDVEFQVHKVILCNCSPYFRSLFLRWSAPNQRVYDITYITPAIMEIIIKFAYTGSFPVTVDNIMDLMRAADQYNIIDMVQACSIFMEKQLNARNCISIFKFTSTYYSPDLHSKAYRYILDHYDEVFLSEELVLFTAKELTELFGRDDLIVRSETLVYESIIKWVNHIPEQRKGHLHELMSKVRMCLMGTEYLLKNVLSNDMVKTNASCLAMVMEAHSLLSRRPATQGSIAFCNPFFRPRFPSAILLATGGWSRGDPTNAIEAYDTRINRWVTVAPSEEQPRAYHGTAFLDGYIYFIGGFDRVQYFNSVRRFDPIRYLWKEVSPMKRSRCYVSVTILNGVIYALGGFNGYRRLSSAESYQPQINQWDLIASMHEQRSDASCTTLHGKVYVCGGFNGLASLQSAEYYSPKTNQWTLICHMSSHRSGLGVIAYRDCIYAVGGNDGTEGNDRLRSAEVYNPQTNNWSDLSSMITTRSNFGIEVIDDRIFVVGGFDGLSTSVAVESYDATLNVWTEACDMGITRSALSCCVVYGLPNMGEYTINRDNLRIYELEELEDM